MAQTLQEVMTPNPVSIPEEASVKDAAEAMREADIGDVIVMRGGQACGILTDRDIVIRAVADGRDIDAMKVADIYSEELTALSPLDSVDRAVEVMRERAIRRLPVIDDGQPVGVVSLGDLAVERDRQSALADISAAPPNT